MKTFIPRGYRSIWENNGREELKCIIQYLGSRKKAKIQSLNHHS